MAATDSINAEADLKTIYDESWTLFREIEDGDGPSGSKEVQVFFYP